MLKSLGGEPPFTDNVLCFGFLCLLYIGSLLFFFPLQSILIYTSINSKNLNC